MLTEAELARAPAAPATATEPTKAAPAVDDKAKAKGGDKKAK
jgi:hypothetical protein